MAKRQAISEQVTLPLAMAFEVVWQGIRIRLGRSLVTVMGVVLGIAFLMSILASNIIKKSVSEEEELRQSVKRMANFLAAEIGPPRNRTYGVVALGPPAEAELRLLEDLREGKAAELRFTWGAGGSHSVRPRPQGNLALQPRLAALVREVPHNQLGKGVHVLLVIGQGPSTGIDWLTLAKGARNKIVAHTRAGRLENAGGLTTVALQREPQPEEIARLKAEKAKNKFRRWWIIVISLLVTIICISNSMLMSVTERFREIGTMKCLGALSAFIRRMFLIESTLMGLVGSIAGCIFGVLFCLLAYGITYGFNQVLASLEVMTILSYAGICLAAGVILSFVAAICPASIASRMVPANALRTNI